MILAKNPLSRISIGHIACPTRGHAVGRDRGYIRKNSPSSVTNRMSPGQVPFNASGTTQSQRSAHSDSSINSRHRKLNVRQVLKSARRIAALFLVFLWFITPLHAQLLPLQVSTHLIPGYPPYSSGHTSTGAKNFILNLRIDDVALLEYDCKLRIIPEGVGIEDKITTEQKVVRSEGSTDLPKYRLRI